MQITSPDFEHGSLISQEYTCDGENIHPELEITGVPKRAESLVMIVEDPDVPSSIREDNLWVHWMVFDIEPEDQVIAPGKGFATGVEGVTTYGRPGYGGPCPPDGEHRYYFKIIALDTKIDLDEEATREDVMNAMTGHIVEKGELMGRYERR